MLAPKHAVTLALLAPLASVAETLKVSLDPLVSLGITKAPH
jgi:hypothetical protein